MKYIALLAIFATAFAAPAPENQMVIDAPAMYNEHDGNSPHVEVNVYLNGEASVSQNNDPGRFCDECGSQTLNDDMTMKVCGDNGGQDELCKKEGRMSCINSKLSEDEFKKQCVDNKCKSVKSCSSSPQSKDQEGLFVFKTSKPVPSPTPIVAACNGCGSETVDNLKTKMVCCEARGDYKLCGKLGPHVCETTHIDAQKFQAYCKDIGCQGKGRTCANPTFDDQEGRYLNEL